MPEPHYLPTGVLEDEGRGFQMSLLQLMPGMLRSVTVLPDVRAD